MARFIDFYSRQWPKVAAVGSMAIGGVSVLASRKNPPSLRSLAVMNSMTMAAHQFEEYVEPGTFPGDVNRGLFKSKNPRSYPFNTRSAAIANGSFTALYLLPILFPRVKWLGLPPALLGILQGFAHGVLEPVKLRKTYTAGAATALLLHVPIGITYLSQLRSRGPISRGDWVKTSGVLAVFLGLGVAAPHVLLGDLHSPHEFTDKQLGLDCDASDEAGPAA